MYSIYENIMCYKIWKWSLFFQPTNPFEDINTKDIKNGTVFTDSHPIKLETHDMNLQRLFTF